MSGIPRIVQTCTRLSSLRANRVHILHFRMRIIRPCILRAPIPSRSIIPLIEEDYAIVSVEPADPPGDMVGTDWYCYIIEQGENTIRGYQQGSVKSVTQAVEEIVARLNERRHGKKGRVHLTMSAPAKKAKRQ
jgi:hypothetical protein